MTPHIHTWEEAQALPDLPLDREPEAGLYRQGIPGGFGRITSYRIWEFTGEGLTRTRQALTVVFEPRTVPEPSKALPVSVAGWGAKPHQVLTAPDDSGTPLDVINKAAHYNVSKYEVIEVLKEWGFEKDALLWNAMKYLARCFYKGSLLENLKKSRYYLDRRIRELEAEILAGPHAD